MSGFIRLYEFGSGSDRLVHVISSYYRLRQVRLYYASLEEVRPG
jgi:hypothetical protein